MPAWWSSKRRLLTLGTGAAAARALGEWVGVQGRMEAGPQQVLRLMPGSNSTSQVMTFAHSASRSTIVEQCVCQADRLATGSLAD